MCRMKCLDRFNSKMSLSGGSLRNENVKNSRELLKETFFDDASLSLGIYLWELGLKDYSDRDTIDIRLYKRAFSNANGETVSFQTLNDTPITVGDIIYDSLHDKYMICTESFDIDCIHWQGKFTVCNWILKWQNKDGDILEYPCHDINSTQYNSGEQSNKLFTLGSSQHMVTLPCDDNTVVIKSPQRFFLDRDHDHPTTFIVTQNDSTSYNYGNKGLVRITMAESQHNPKTDRVDLGICDYFEKEVLVKDNADEKFISKSVISYTSSVIKSGGSPQTFAGNFFDGDGNEILDVVPHWNIICDFSDALYVEEIDNKLLISIDDDDYVDEEFKIVLSDEEGNYSSDVIVRVESLL